MEADIEFGNVQLTEGKGARVGGGERVVVCRGGTVLSLSTGCYTLYMRLGRTAV
jgi:hypothetical protein